MTTLLKNQSHKLVMVTCPVEFLTTSSVIKQCSYECILLLFESLTHRKQAACKILPLVDYFSLYCPPFLLSVYYYSKSLLLRKTTTSEPGTHTLKMASFDKVFSIVQWGRTSWFFYSDLVISEPGQFASVEAHVPMCKCSTKTNELKMKQSVFPRTP